MRKITKRSCKICSKEFIPKIYNELTCGSECSYQNKLRISREQAERKRNTPIIRKCRTCGKKVISNAWCTQSFCGGKYGECFREFYSKGGMGKKNPAYRNGFAVIGKRTYTGVHLRACKKYREKFLDKNEYLFCEICGVNKNGTTKFEVHHIYYASLHPKHKELHNTKNLIMLCIKCHNDLHSGKMRSDIFLKLEKDRGLKELFI